MSGPRTSHFIVAALVCVFVAVLSLFASTPVLYFGFAALAGVLTWLAIEVWNDIRS